MAVHEAGLGGINQLHSGTEIEQRNRNGARQVSLKPFSSAANIHQLQGAIALESLAEARASLDGYAREADSFLAPSVFVCQRICDDPFETDPGQPKAGFLSMWFLVGHDDQVQVGFEQHRRPTGKRSHETKLHRSPDVKLRESLGIPRVEDNRAFSLFLDNLCRQQERNPR